MGGGLNSVAQAGLQLTETPLVPKSAPEITGLSHPGRLTFLVLFRDMVSLCRGSASCYVDQAGLELMVLGLTALTTTTPCFLDGVVGDLPKRQGMGMGRWKGAMGGLGDNYRVYFEVLFVCRLDMKQDLNNLGFPSRRAAPMLLCASGWPVPGGCLVGGVFKYLPLSSSYLSGRVWYHSAPASRHQCPSHPHTYGHLS